ncbi:unnamed protein product [Cuscuta campestris]|uniref:Uncharacterized protein n=1 Tax=Cuscuta campestris TaxID=132261 RepID=A0A484L178_9ASTE|nr:unnamed protein product [Cuscuta campestris]
MGCRFPLHPLLIELCNRYAIPPGQISSNSHESLFGFLARCHKRGIQPTPKLFLSFFRPHKYDSELGRGYVSFTARTDMQFWDSPVDKLDDWFRRFFVVVVPENLPFPNVWRKKEDKFPSHTFPPRDSELDGIYRLLLKNGHPVPRALLFKDSNLWGLGFWVSPDIPLQEPSGNTTSSWVPPFRSTRLRRRSSRWDPSLEEDTEGEEAGSVTGTQPMLLADRPHLSEEVVVEEVSDDDGLYDFPPGTLRGSDLIPGVPHTPLFGKGAPPSAQFMGPLGFHPQPTGTFPIGRATGSQGSLEPPHVQVAGIGIPCSTGSPWEYSPSSGCGGNEAISQPQPSTALNFAESAAESIFGTPLGQGGVPLPGANIHRSFRETEEKIRSSSFGKVIVPSSVRPTDVPGPSTQETGSSSSSQAHHKRGRNSTPLPGSLVSAGPSMGTAGHFFGTAGDGSATGQGSQPFPYAREAYQYTGYTAWVGRDFNSKLQEIQQLKRDHPDVIHSPVWPFMQEEYTHMADYVATTSAQRHSLRLLDHNAALSKELRDFKSRHSICVERPEYKWVLSENDQLYSDRERLSAKVGQREESLRRDLERQAKKRELQVREEAELHRKRFEEELERTWRRRSEEEARKAAEEVEQRWRLQHEETECRLSQRVDELNLTLMEERRSARSSLDEARRSLENERLTYEGHMARMEADRISDYDRGFYRGGLEVQQKFYHGLEPYSDGQDPWLKFPGIPGPMGPEPSFLRSPPPS